MKNTKGNLRIKPEESTLMTPSSSLKDLIIKSSNSALDHRKAERAKDPHRFYSHNFDKNKKRRNFIDGGEDSADEHIKIGFDDLEND